MRVVMILIGFWSLLQAGGALVGIPSYFVAIGPLLPWQVHRIIELHLATTLFLALVGAFGLLKPWAFGRHATLVALTLNIGYSLALPLLDTEIDPWRAYPRLGFFALVNVVAAAVLTSRRARATCGPRHEGALQPQGS